MDEIPQTKVEGENSAGGVGLANRFRPLTSVVVAPEESPPPADTAQPEVAAPRAAGPVVGGVAYEELKHRLHHLLIGELEANELQKLTGPKAREAVEAAARAMLQQEAPNVIGLTRDSLIRAVADEVLGFGPIEPLLRDPTVTEVMVNNPDEVYIEVDGKLHLSPARFRDDEHIVRIIDRIIAPLGRRVDEQSPMVDARLPDGSRVNAVIPPVSPRGPLITVRKFRADKLTMDDLVAGETLTRRAAQFLGACVRIRRSMAISGGTGAGKTTLLNALSGYVPEGERIVTIEDPVELKLLQPHTIVLEARPPSLEGRGEITQRDLVRNALRMRPDRIIVGEVRSREAFDMLQAMNTGHEGSLTTVHANSPRDALARIENMVLMAGMDLPLRAARDQIASALDLVIQIARFPDGVRRVTHIVEVTGIEGQVVTMQELFRFLQRGLDAEGRVLGELLPTGIRPTFSEQFELAGISLPVDLFDAGRW